MTAQDFVYGWRRRVDPKNASPTASSGGAYILNGEAVAQGKRPLADPDVRAIDSEILASTITADGQPPLYALAVKGNEGVDML